MNYRVMEMEFRASNSRKVVMIGICNGGPQTTLAKKMEAIYKHKDVAYIAKCSIT